jgi:ABC-type transport system substrate-binding protein
MGAGANPQGSEASRNTYDPLWTCAVKKDANGNDHYDPPAKFKPELPTLCVINSALAKKNATDKDPWAMDWLKNNEAGSGGYRVKKWTSGQELVYQRFDDWKSGPLPKIER